MSFWDSVKDAAKGAAKSAGSYAKKQMDDMREYQEEYRSLSDEALYRKFKNSTGTKKAVCLHLLKERDFHPDDL